MKVIISPYIYPAIPLFQKEIETNETLSEKEIISTVSNYFSIPTCILLKERRNKYERAILMYLLKHKLKYNTSQIGKLVDLNRSSVSSSLLTLESKRKIYPEYNLDINRIDNILKKAK